MDQDKKTILVVDDEEDICDLGRFCFERADFKVFTAGSVAEAIGILEHNHIDAVICDIRMPEGNGTELLKHISGKPGQPLVYLMTGFSDLSEAAALQLGAAGILAKPFDWKAAQTMIQRALGLIS